MARSTLLSRAAMSKAGAKAPGRFMLVPARIVSKPGRLAAATSKASSQATSKAGKLARAYPKGQGPTAASARVSRCLNRRGLMRVPRPGRSTAEGPTLSVLLATGTACPLTTSGARGAGRRAPCCERLLEGWCCHAHDEMPCCPVLRCRMVPFSHAPLESAAKVRNG